MKRYMTLLVAVLIITSTHAQTTLSLNLQKGEEYNQNASLEITTVTEAMGMEFEIITTIAADITFQVNEVKPDGYEMTAKYKQMRLGLELSGEVTEYVSDDPDSSEPLSRVYHRMMNQPFGVTMERSGKITDIRNMEEVIGEAVDNNTTLNEREKEEMRAQMR